MRRVLVAAAAVVLLTLPLTEAAGLKLGRLLRSSQKEEPSYVAWSPPPDFASKTWGHKTMYLADVTIGTAGQTFRMLVDTGSWMVVLPSAACRQAGCKGHRRLDTRNSTRSTQTASISFAHGSVSGSIFSDTICAGSGSTRLREVGLLQRSRRASRHRQSKLNGGGNGRTCAQMSFLVAEHESDDFVDAPFDGILGLGLQGGPDSGVGKAGERFSFVRQLTAQGHLPESIFVLRLGNDGESELVFGDVDESSLVGGQLLWVPLSAAADGHWQISVSDLTLDGARQHMGEMEVIVDSGTSLLAPDDDLAAWMKDRLAPHDCSKVNSLPRLGLRLKGGGTLTMLPSDYIDRIDGRCNLAVMPLNVSGAAAAAAHSVPPRLILGDSFLRRFTTAFDLGRRRLGFGIASGGDEAKELAEALFPDISPAALGEFAAQRTAEQQSAEDSLEDPHGLAEHMAAARKQRLQQKEVPKPTTAPENRTMSAEEQAGYDFVLHMSDHNDVLKPAVAQWDLPHRKHVLRRAKAPTGNSTEDKLRTAGDNLDRMLAGLKPQAAATPKQDVHADKVKMHVVTAQPQDVNKVREQPRVQEAGVLTAGEQSSSSSSTGSLAEPTVAADTVAAIDGHLQGIVAGLDAYPQSVDGTTAAADAADAADAAADADATPAGVVAAAVADVSSVPEAAGGEEAVVGENAAGVNAETTRSDEAVPPSVSDEQPALRKLAEQAAAVGKIPAEDVEEKRRFYDQFYVFDNEESDVDEEEADTEASLASAISGVTAARL